MLAVPLPASTNKTDLVLAVNVLRDANGMGWGRGQELGPCDQQPGGGGGRTSKLVDLAANTVKAVHTEGDRAIRLEEQLPLLEGSITALRGLLAGQEARPACHAGGGLGGHGWAASVPEIQVPKLWL
jgi:hypothetical protein